MIHQEALTVDEPPRWRVLLSTAHLLMAAFVAYVTWSLVFTGLAQSVPAIGRASRGGAHRDLFNLLSNNLILACAVPVTLFATWAAYRTPGLLMSVTGRLRTRLLGVCAALAVVVQGVGMWLVSLGSHNAPRGHPTDVAVLLLVVLLTTPLQAAGEEFFFRGWLPQQIGVLLRAPGPTLVVGALVSSGLFALAHGQQNPWLMADRFCFGLLSFALVWRTGGLEASIALHAVNNMVVFVPVILAGRLHDSLQVTQATPGAVVADLVIVVAYVGAVLTVLPRLPTRRGPTLAPVR